MSAMVLIFFLSSRWEGYRRNPPGVFEVSSDGRFLRNIQKGCLPTGRNGLTMFPSAGTLLLRNNKRKGLVCGNTLIFQPLLLGLWLSCFRKFGTILNIFFVCFPIGFSKKSCICAFANIVFALENAYGRQMPAFQSVPNMASVNKTVICDCTMLFLPEGYMRLIYFPTQDALALSKC